MFQVEEIDPHKEHAPKKKLFFNLSCGQILLLHLAVLSVAVGIHFFKFPNHFTMGGISGLSVVLGAITPINPSTWTAIGNSLLLLIGLLVIGRSFAVGTAYVSLLLSGMLLFLARFFPITKPITHHPLVELAFAALLPALGAAILFNMKFSTGGTDIIAMIIHQRSSFDIGRTLAAIDLIVAIIAAFVFSIETALLSLIGLLLKGVAVDLVLESVNEVKYFTIVSTHADDISRYITRNLKRGATLLEGKGAFTDEPKGIILCVLKRHQAVLLRDYVKSIDPKAFIMISNTSQIVGKGFYSTF